MDFAAKQPNDGYTFVVGNLGPVAVNPLLSKVPYNIEKDFVPVSMISTGPNVLVVRDRLHRSLGEIASQSRTRKLNYGTSGPGSVSHLSSEMLKNITKVDAVEVAYKGGVLAVQDLLGGQINFIFSDSLPAMQHIRAGKLRALCDRDAALRALPSRRRARATPRASWRSTGGVLFPPARRARSCRSSTPTPSRRSPTPT